MSRRLLLILALIAVALAVVAGLVVQKRAHPPRRPALVTAAVGGPFQLVDQTGRKVDQRVLDGKWSAVFFGYTFCPDACPTTMFALGQAEKLLGAKGDRFQTVFVSVDPERDTPAEIARFLSTDAFPKHVIGLTGTPAEVDAAAKAYHVYYGKAGEGAAYAVNHSTISYLMNPKGRFACPIPYDATPQQIAARVEAAMAHGDDAESC